AGTKSFFWNACSEGLLAYGCDVVLLCLQLVCDSDHGSNATNFSLPVHLPCLSIVINVAPPTCGAFFSLI
ncbi:hypothetical protein QUG67_19070, partial [Enterobacter hormaechei]|uniref:hypothetical protein n=2 Tax=Enterobacter hormaechei TaxID=158836 RepID=UPI0025A1A32B